jgi:hypothetical protein
MKSVARPGIVCAITLAVLLAPGCRGKKSKGIDDSSRFDFSAMAVDSEIDVEFDDGFGTFETPLERKKVGARFAFGRSGSRGFFDVYTEEFGSNNNDAPDFNGIGGGMQGIPIVGGNKGNLSVVVPFMWSLAFAANDDDEPGVVSDVLRYYLEAQARIGIGIAWFGLIPSVGIAANMLTGTIDFDEDSAPGARDIDFDATSIGVYAGLEYRPTFMPLYAALRVLSGDHDTTDLIVGVEF